MPGDSKKGRTVLSSSQINRYLLDSESFLIILIIISFFDAFQIAYRNWLCATILPFYRRRRLVTPCHSYCHEVATHCPYLLPHAEYNYAGEPSFICPSKMNANNINNNNAIKMLIIIIILIIVIIIIITEIH